MPTPTIPDGELFMNATTYTGNGGTQTITNGNPGQSFQPDLVWAKQRNGTAFHALFDSVRGATKVIQSNTTTAEQTFATALTSFNSNGFTSGSSTDTNQSGQSYVAWQWKAGGTAVTNTAGSISAQVSANTTSGFSVVTYTGNNVAGATIGHGLGVAPSIIIVKKRSTTGDWPVYHRSLGATGELVLNSTTAFITITGVWNNTAPTSSVFSVGGGGASGSADVNANGSTYVAYCWSEITGYSAFGSYTGNGSNDGAFIYTGFRPRWFLVKRTDSAGSWVLTDTSRSPINVTDQQLYPNLSNAESGEGSQGTWDMLSNGVKMRYSASNYNASGGTYIYMAFAENPFKYSLAR
jgi:hypothetical protein